MANPDPILIVGGFGVSWNIYQPFRAVLQSVSNRAVFLTRLEMLDWLSVVMSDDYSNLLKRLHSSVTDTLRRTGAERLMLLGHSAGGIVARIYMGDQPYGRESLVFNGFQRVSALVTIGTPHTTPKRGRFGGLNQITFANERYPGAYWRFIRYVTVIARSIRGVRNGAPYERNACESYMMLTNECDQWGDGVVPLSCSALEGAYNLQLEGLRHDPRPDERPWYGHNEETVGSWWEHVERAEQAPVPGVVEATA
jgi:pimeloyl-ACP methyl ester carboxylesterase